MKHIAGWFRRNNTLMAQAKDLARQLAEAWQVVANMRGFNVELLETRDSLREQLHRVARERDEERRLRLEAEDRLLDRYLDEDDKLKRLIRDMLNDDDCKVHGDFFHRAVSLLAQDIELAQAAEELRDTYLEEE